MPDTALETSRKAIGVEIFDSPRAAHLTAAHQGSRAFVEPLKNEELLSAPGGVDMEMIQVFARSSDTGSLAPGQIITFNGQRWQVMHFFDLDGVSKMMLGRNYA